MSERPISESYLSSRFSRRSVLRSAIAIGISGSLLSACEVREVSRPVDDDQDADDTTDDDGDDDEPAPTGTGNLTLSMHEFNTVNAITSRIFPSGEDGLGAVEARAAVYIDRALGAHHSWARDSYARNLAALDELAMDEEDDQFINLSEDQQDELLQMLADDEASGFEPDAASFFSQVRGHTQEGMFADPAYGGNADFVGWDLLGFPGIKMGFSENEQQLDVEVEPERRSTYDIPMFQPIDPGDDDNGQNA